MNLVVSASIVRLVELLVFVLQLVFGNFDFFDFKFEFADFVDEVSYVVF